jgi:transposase
VLFSDECGVYLLPMVRQTWAPKGNSPVLREHCGYEHLSIAGAISSCGNLVFWCRKSSFKGFECAAFLEYVADCYRKNKLTLIWDGAAIHKSLPVKEFLAEKPGKIRLEQLPAYSPELNPIELLWAYLKKKMANHIFLNLDQLYQAICEELNHIKNNRKLIQSFFKKKSVGWLP